VSQQVTSGQENYSHSIVPGGLLVTPERVVRIGVNQKSFTPKSSFTPLQGFHSGAGTHSFRQRLVPGKARFEYVSNPNKKWLFHLGTAAAKERSAGSANLDNTSRAEPRTEKLKTKI
jgi:hypothetical protein